MENSSKHIVDDAALTRFILGKADADETSLVLDELEHKPDVRERYDTLNNTIMQYDNYYSEKNIDVNRAKNVFLEQIEAEDERNEPASSQPHTRIHPLLKIASVIIPLLGAIFIYILTRPITINSGNTVLIHSLSDGSEATLNKESTLVYSRSFGNKEREVSLSGEAYFDVASNAEIPFRVVTDKLNVVVTGTSFSIKTKSDDGTTVVAVDEGYVRVEESITDKSLQLAAGEKLRYASEQKFLEKETFEDRNDIAWKTGKLVFRQASLENVAVKLSEYYDVPIRLSDDIQELKLTSTFEQEDIDTVLEIISLIHNLEYEKKDNLIIITQSDNSTN